MQGNHRLDGRGGRRNGGGPPRTGGETGLPRKDGKINESIYRMREELIERKQKKEWYGRIGSLGMVVGSLPLLGLFVLRSSDYRGLLNYFTSPLVFFGILIILFSYAFTRIYYQKAKDKYDALKEELISKIWNDFCNCWNACSHKEDFLKETDEVYGINLYWK